MPKDFIGIIGLNAVAKNAPAVVLDVTAVARAALLNAKASRLWISPEISLMFAVCRHPSTNTNMSSAAIPRTMNIAN